MDSSKRTGMSAFIGSFLLVMSQAGHAVTISETPLFIATGVTPNVMLLVDNSGSMESIIWARLPKLASARATYGSASAIASAAHLKIIFFMSIRFLPAVFL